MAKEKLIIAPSLLSADFLHLEDELNKMHELGVNWLHFDVMDGHFVDNISFGIPLLKAVEKKHYFFNDVHLMISNPRKFILPFKEAGAHLITFHVEALSSAEEGKELIAYMRSLGLKVGISLRPKTAVEDLLPYLPLVDLVLVMSVEPGFGGQEFLSKAYSKIALLRYYREQDRLSFKIEVDGGVNHVTGYYARANGADILVAGSYLFGHDDLKERLESLDY